MWCKIDDTVCSVTELAFPGVALGDAQNDLIESLNFLGIVSKWLRYYIGV